MRPTEVYERVTAQVIRQIEAGKRTATWRMPWHAIAEVGQPVNATTGAAYRGGNHMMFAMVAQANRWSNYWATYRQWNDLGMHVRKGERSTSGTHWSTLTRWTRPDQQDEEPAEGRRRVPHVFSVFNAAQVDGWEPPEPPTRDTPERIGTAEQFFATVGADVRIGGNQAGYSPVGDFVVLPHLSQFDRIGDYYATSAHEHAHWTGHSARLARDLTGRFGTDSYAVEELVAELSAAFTCAHLGISAAPRPDHAVYIAGWLRALRADTSALFHTASKAQAATDFLVSERSDRTRQAA